MKQDSYVGEVLVRQAGAEWAVSEEQKSVFGLPLILRAGRIQASPRTRCYRRLKSDNDGVEAWGRLVTAVASGNIPEEVPERKGGEEVPGQSGDF